MHTVGVASSSIRQKVAMQIARGQQCFQNDPCVWCMTRVLCQGFWGWILQCDLPSQRDKRQCPGLWDPRVTYTGGGGWSEGWDHPPQTGFSRTIAMVPHKNSLGPLLENGDLLQKGPLSL